MNKQTKYRCNKGGVVISILQEYEKIRKLIGEDRWNNIDSYIKENPELTFDKLIYNMFNWVKFDRWYNKEIKHQQVEILGTWGTDYGDIGCQAILYKDGKQVANVIDSEEETTVRYVYGDSHSELTEELVKASFEFLINNDFDKYLKLPKISECSNLLQEIYDSVCESDASMCHVDDEDWMYWKDSFGFKDDDIEVLKKEIKKYGLDEVIGIGDSGYKIVGYGNLQSMFNDDRTIAKDYALDENNKLEILKTCKDYHILVNNLKYEFLEEIENKLQHYLNYISKNDNIDDYKKEYGNHDIVNWFEGTMDTKDFLRYNIKNKIDKNIEKGDSYEML